MDVASSPPGPEILIVGSSPADGEHIIDLLRTSAPDFRVATAADTPEAVQAMVEAPPSCIVLDLSGFRAEPLVAMDELGAAAPETPIIILTDDQDEEQALFAVRAGAQDFLIKSELSPTLLCRAIKYAIERKRAEVKLAHQALHDSLTGLPNRAVFMDRLGVALDRARRLQTGVGVLFLDVDNFKEINDTLGHEAGDRVLSGLAERLLTLLRPMDTVARLGGDEFTFLVEDLSGEREVVLIAERISHAANLPIALESGRVSISVSIGIAMVMGEAVAPEALLREADAAMYRSKRRGRGGYELFDERSRRRALERAKLENGLRRALQRSELRVHYQPGVALRDQSGVKSLEALVRWYHPERGLIEPSEFIPVAEETGLMIPIGRFVLEQALAQLEGWRRRLPAVTVSVNLSARQLDDLSLISMLGAALRQSAVDPAAVSLEIQERAIGEDPESVAVALDGLKATGVRLAIDNFGTAASSLTTLKELPIDTIKLHRSLVSGLDSDPRERPILGAVVDLGHALGCGVVAEGVETEAQATALRAIGCDAAQGFLFGRPVPEEEVEHLLSATGSVELRAAPSSP